MDQNEQSDLACVTVFVHEQLRMTHTPNPESFKVAFSKNDGYEASDITHTIFVPRILKDVIKERHNKDKYATQEKFLNWYHRICENRIQRFHSLYTYTQAGRELSQVSDSLEKMKQVFKQQDKRNYRVAQAVIDHEKTHILNKDVQKRILLCSLTPVATAIAFTAGMQTSQKLDQSELSSYAIGVGTALVNLSAYFLTYKAVIRRQECRADAGTRNDSKILQAVSDRLIYLAEQAHPNDEDVHPIRNFFSNHPLLNKRAEALKKQAIGLSNRTPNVNRRC